MRVVVVGAGIAGLVAARELVAAGHGVVVLEAAGQAGGKLRRRRVAGVQVDVGAEAFLARRPEALALAGELGLAVVHPTPATSRVWTRGALRPLPRTLMGAPLDADQLAESGVLSPAGLARAVVERVVPVEGDPTVGDLVAERFGDEVVEALVEPLLGGVYAGRARQISARAAVPQLVALAERGSISAQVAGLPVDASPVFAGLEGGVGGLVAVLAARLDVRVSSQVHDVRRDGSGFVVGVVAPDGSRAVERCDAVVLATPAAATSRLLADLAPAAATELGAVRSASVAVITLAFDRDEVAGLLDAEVSGFLVPPAEGHRIKAATFSAAKWAWVREAGATTGVVHVRTSIGRIGDEAHLRRSDDDLIARSLGELGVVAGARAIPLDVHVQRWDEALPQYAPGHLDRVARIRSAVGAVPGLAVCGAAYDGVGVAAVIGSARRAAAELAAPGADTGRGMMEP